MESVHCPGLALEICVRAYKKKGRQRRGLQRSAVECLKVLNRQIITMYIYMNMQQKK